MMVYWLVGRQVGWLAGWLVYVNSARSEYPKLKSHRVPRVPDLAGSRHQWHQDWQCEAQKTIVNMGELLRSDAI